MYENKIMIKFYGHACLYIKTPNVSIVTDPWFSKEGAFLSTWFQFPDNTELDLTPIRNVDYVILSHEHQDHFDLKFLKTINPNAKIIIPKYTDMYLYDTLRDNLKNEIIVANSLQKIALGPDVTFCPIVQSVPIWDDCTLLFETPEGTIADVNDMKIVNKDLEWIKNNFNIDYLFIQFSGANWHPTVYNYAHEKKAEIAKHKIITKFHNVKANFETSGAKCLIPCAGPPCFLDDEHYEINFSDESIFPTQADFYEFAKKEGLDNKTHILMPGDVFDPSQDCKVISQKNLQREEFAKKRQYLESYKQRRQNIINKELSSIKVPTESIFGKCKEYFEPLIASSSYFREKINGKILLDVTGPFSEKIIVDFAKAKDSVKPFENEDFFYRLEINSRFLNLIFDRKLTWEQLLLSIRFKASRNPDEYNEALIVFLRFADANSYKAYELYETRKDFSETFLLEYEGEKYEAQRYCPHAMGDLSKGRLVDACIVCPNHGWKFSIKDGKALSKNASIKIKKLEQESTSSVT